MEQGFSHCRKGKLAFIIKACGYFVKEKNVRIWIGYRKKTYSGEQRNKEWSRAMVDGRQMNIIYEDETDSCVQETQWDGGAECAGTVRLDQEK